MNEVDRCLDKKKKEKMKKERKRREGSGDRA